MENCSIEYALNIIGGKWKLLILWTMSKNGVIRFNELQRKVDGISSLMLSKNLKELEEDCLIIRRQYNEIPPRVEYELSELSQKLIVALQVLGEWGEEVYKHKHPSI
ncbi:MULTISPECIES: helix-turn-helix domain-containing protein [unclassified Clostridium]|uniref:winged helix-turn-helix transcriptional regulator n=1 Tax=unclassified Clostridium TaxID=2614128 RepID=UPI000297AD16|nr:MULTISPECIES: helix-turn-helix domain-containing protein [unclassified Clostridium]EKQ56155.1 MAG: putative transcriptional regulator [Clostridium sp. Maddingley MBC34-26]